MGENVCRARKVNLRETTPALRQNHLHMQLVDAESKEQKERAKAVKAKMERERQCKMWFFINRSQKDPRCGAFHTVQRMEGDSVVESTSQEETEQFIFDETEYRFQLAAEAPISRTKIIDQLGYLGDSEMRNS